MGTRTGNPSGQRNRNNYGRYRDERERESDYDDYSNDYRNEYDDYDDDDDFWDEYISYDDEDRYDDDGYNAGGLRRREGMRPASFMSENPGEIVRSGGRFSRKGGYHWRGGDTSRGEGVSYYRSSVNTLPRNRRKGFSKAGQEWELGRMRVNRSDYESDGRRYPTRAAHRSFDEFMNPEEFHEAKSMEDMPFEYRTGNEWEREDALGLENMRGVARWRHATISPYQEEQDLWEENVRGNGSEFDQLRREEPEQNLRVRAIPRNGLRKRHIRYPSHY